MNNSKTNNSKTNNSIIANTLKSNSIANRLINNIVKVVYKDDNTNLTYNNITYSKIIHKYSNTKKAIYRLYIDNKLIKRNNSYRVHYKCICCDTINIVNFNNIVKKINKNIYRCKMCSILDIDRRKNHSLFMRETFLKNGCVKSNKVKKNKIGVLLFLENSNNEFNNMDDDYKDDYYNRHLTFDEFSNIKDKIISFQNDKFLDINNFKYYPTVRISNQTYFNPYLLDISRNILEKPNYIKLRCDKCNNVYTHRDLFKLKNKIKLYCQDCTFCNRTFKIRSLKNIDNNKITYQSKLELKFIKYCNKNNILIENGPIIIYSWDNKNKLRYIVDFYIPKLNYLIELKDYHHWHKQQIKNGKWDCKLKAVNELLKSNKYNKFILITTKNFMEKLKQIRQDINKI